MACLWKKASGHFMSMQTALAVGEEKERLMRPTRASAGTRRLQRPEPAQPIGPGMKVTIRNVAKLAGVAPSTVSHYLNRTAQLAPETAQKVERARGGRLPSPATTTWAGNWQRSIWSAQAIVESRSFEVNRPSATWRTGSPAGMLASSGKVSSSAPSMTCLTAS